MAIKSEAFEIVLFRERRAAAAIKMSADKIVQKIGMLNIPENTIPRQNGINTYRAGRFMRHPSHYCAWNHLNKIESGFIPPLFLFLFFRITLRLPLLHS